MKQRTPRGNVLNEHEALDNIVEKIWGSEPTKDNRHADTD